MPGSEGTVVLNGVPYRLVSERLLPSGRRGITRQTRRSDGSDRAITRTRKWKLSGPIGQSRERDDGFLGTDWAELDTLYDDLLTSAPQQTNVSLSSSDPFSTASSALGGFALGAAALGGGTSLSTPQTVSHIEQDRGALFWHRGAFSTQVNSSFTTVQTVTHGSVVQGASGPWQGEAFLGLGSNVAIQRRTSVSSTGASYTDVQVDGTDENAGEMLVGSDRLWMVDANTGDEGKAEYSLDDLSAFSNSFSVGNHQIGATAIGTLGPYTIFGTEDGVFGFTDAGKPVRVNDALRGHRSQNNGRRHASLWGWNYHTTDIGLYCWRPNVNNPVGIEAIKGFEGDIDGRPTTVFAWRESLFCAYLTTAGHTYILRGMFGPRTASVGLPEWYFFAKFSSEECDAISATSLSTNPNILAGRDTEGARFIMGRRGRDIADSNYRFDTTGGAWYGSTLMTVPGLHGNLRYMSFLTENADGDNNWQAAVSVDEGSYVNVGSAVTSNGHQTVRPVSGGVPLTTVDFHTLKPRLTQAADSTTAPPQIRGELTVVYDERPDMVEEATLVIHLGGLREAESEWADLTGLDDHGQGTPVKIQLTDDATARYGFVTGVSDRTDLKGDGIESVTVTVTAWETS